MDDRPVLDVGARADADEFRSPRTRQWNQIPVSAPITTSPITAAVGAMKASAAITGVTPSARRRAEAAIGGSGMSQLPLRRRRRADPSINPMFCTAAPDAPLPRLSSRATSTA